MDISAFISELLARQNVLIVPGLGTFSRVRAEGYYNKEQQQFYPPSQQIQYKSEYSDDDVLAEYIAKERHISITSARYFIEKLVTGLLEQVSINTVQFGNMGTFSMRRGQLIFTPSELNEADELFYGLAPVKLKRNSSFRQQAVVIPPKPVITEEPVAEPVTEQPAPVEPPPVIEVPAAAENTEEYYDEEEVTDGSKVNIWLVLAIIIVLIGIGIIGTYIYKPALFGNFKPMFGKLTNTAPPAVKKPDTDSLQKDTVAATPAIAKTDSVAPVDTFGIVVGQFKTQSKALLDAGRYTKKGFKAGVHQNPDKKHYDVNVGIYLNNDTAKNALSVAKQKLKTQDITIHTYPFKKQ